MSAMNRHPGLSRHQLAQRCLKDGAQTYRSSCRRFWHSDIMGVLAWPRHWEPVGDMEERVIKATRGMWEVEGAEVAWVERHRRSAKEAFWCEVCRSAFVGSTMRRRRRDLQDCKLRGSGTWRVADSNGLRMGEARKWNKVRWGFENEGSLSRMGNAPLTCSHSAIQPSEARALQQATRQGSRKGRRRKMTRWWGWQGVLSVSAISAGYACLWFKASSWPTNCLRHALCWWEALRTERSHYGHNLKLIPRFENDMVRPLDETESSRSPVAPIKFL
jgi:hypothetical protein